MTLFEGRTLRFGSFITPAAHDPDATVALAVASEAAGLDVVTFQDHPYQPAYLDTWTLLAFVAARTERIHVSANVHCLPLRPPAVLARAAASLDRLSSGRVSLGLGAGAYWDAIVAMGGERLDPGQSVGALEEALAIIRAIWDTDARGGVFRRGDVHAVSGAKRGPAPAHRIPVWLGAYKPRMLRLVGTSADGWLPSLGYLRDASALDDANAVIDEAARGSGRDPASIRRLLNISPADARPQTLGRLALDHGVDTFILATDDADELERFAGQTAPEVRELVAGR